MQAALAIWHGERVERIEGCSTRCSTSTSPGYRRRRRFVDGAFVALVIVASGVFMVGVVLFVDRGLGRGSRPAVTP